MCTYIIVRVYTCTYVWVCGGQRSASGILLIIIFGDKVSLNPELPSFSRLTGQKSLGIPPSLLLQSQGCRNVLCAQLLTCVPESPSQILLLALADLPTETSPQPLTGISFKKKYTFMEGVMYKGKADTCLIISQWAGPSILGVCENASVKCHWDRSDWSTHDALQWVGGCVARMAKWTHVIWELPTDC